MKCLMQVLAVTTLTASTAAWAQLDDRTVVSVLKECRKIVDVAARVACYDNIPLGQSPAASETPAQPVQGRAAPPAISRPGPERDPRGFGSNQLPQQPGASREPERVRVMVSQSAELSPGVYLLTLEDGAQWQFIDPVGPSYDAPRRGSVVEIASAALGSYLMTYEGQRSIRVRRVR